MPTQTFDDGRSVVMVCAPEDLAALRAVARRLQVDGLSAWLPNDELAGQPDGPRQLRRAVEGAAALVVGLSRRSLGPEGGLHPQIGQLLEAAGAAPGEPALIILKLSSCELPPGLAGARVVELFSFSGYGELLGLLRDRASARPAPTEPAPARPRSPALALRGGFALPDLERQGQLRRIGRGVARALVLLDDDHALAVSGAGAVMLGLADGAPLWAIDCPARAAALSPSGRLLALAYGARIVLWDLAEERIHATCEGHGGTVRALAFSPDERSLASGAHDRSVRLWRVGPPAQRPQLPLATLADLSDHVHCVAFSPDGSLLAAGGDDRSVRVWRTLDRGLAQCLGGAGGTVECLAFSPDGSLLAAGSRGRSAQLWETRGWRLRASLEGHDGAVECLAFSPDSAALASGAGDGSLRLWRSADGSLLRAYPGHSGPVAAVAFSPGGALLASLGESGALLAFAGDGGSGEPVAALSPLSSRITSLAFSPDGATLAAGAGDGSLISYGLDGARLPRVRPADQPGAVGALAFAGPRQLVSAAADHSLRSCEIDGGVSRILMRTSGSQQVIALAATGRLALSSDGMGTLQLWRLRPGQEPPAGEFWRVLRGIASRTILAHFGAAGLAIAGEDGRIALWSIAGLEQGQDQPQAVITTGARLTSLTISPDGGLLASGDADGAVQIWRAADSQPLYRLPGQGHQARSLSFSADARRLAVGESGGAVQIWRLPGGKQQRPPNRPISTIEGHAGSVDYLAFSPAGGLLASGSSDGTVRLWRA